MILIFIITIIGIFAYLDEINKEAKNKKLIEKNFYKNGKCTIKGKQIKFPML